jgi:hypothetical protein
MKVQFNFNGHRYFAPSKQEAIKFIEYWDGVVMNIHPFSTNWDIKTVERGPGWVPVPVFDDDRIEYGKKV